MPTLTNGKETFNIDASNRDCVGSKYELCNIPTCEHPTVPGIASVFWHDVEHTETLWEVPQNVKTHP